ncbi:uncharacterized protein LOC129619229 [Condylostylus longicornis]|uniref:uncharacterized protein LOC129619229 n=1 Tax=Condylostylus longicornis TaxID=2530218 RepID=UPI00244E0DFC|nr:uncharacterized protein LOC129619229 [Condylostylus longicornis]
MDCLSDKDVTEKLRIENYEQYKQLVRMHLSFELDLNTDEFDLPCHEIIYYEKGKLRKWNRLAKKIKSCTSSKNGAGSPLEGGSIQLTFGLINQLKQLRAFLLKEVNLKQEGIFRRTGAVSRQNELRNLMNQHKDFNLDENFSVHDCATVYKGFLADLHEPLLTDAHYPAHCQIADLCNGVEGKEKGEKLNKVNHFLNSMQLLVLLLPNENRILLEDIISMLYETSKYEQYNKMSPDTLALLFSPHLMCPRNLPPEALHYVSQRMSSVVSYMIHKGKVIFDIPSKLATDIRAYFHEMKRKKTMSPEHILDESISDISTVNTVYTFVDREKTAAEHNSNPTDTALAQLYAHIQSLPESSKKRKLIKQFNKENGQGTPLQMLMVNRIKNNEIQRSGGKSFGEAIKKHIFHKGLISRTPKRLNSSTNNSSTPNGAVKTPRTRILFPNPILSHSNFQISRQPQHLDTVNNYSIESPSIKSISKNKVSATQLRHPLQKSVSASSILSLTSTLSSASTNSLDINNSENKPSSSSVCRFSLNECTEKDAAIENDVTGTSKQVNKNVSNDLLASENTVQWLSKKNFNEETDYNFDERTDLTDYDLDKFLTPVKNRGKLRNLKNFNSSLKSKFKSEPNLFNLIPKDEFEKDASDFSYVNLNTDQGNENDGKFIDCIPKTIKNSLIRAVSLGSLIGNLSSSSNIATRSEKLKVTKKFILNKTGCFNKSLNKNELNEESVDSYKDCLSTIQSESEIDPGPEHSTKAEEVNSVEDVHKYKHCFSTEHDEKDVNEFETGDVFIHEDRSVLSITSENVVGSYPNLNLYRNIDLITSTPSQFFRRRSMSPITKSTQRMPKAMQESIMTPRSRKPVMLMATVGSVSHDIQNVLKSDISNFNEHRDPESNSAYLNECESSNNDTTPKIHKIKNIVAPQTITVPQQIFSQIHVLGENSYFMGCTEMEPKSIADAANIRDIDELQKQNLKLNNLNTNATLSSTFREYLLSRSVLTASPVDASFSSQPDDFGSTPDIQDLSESQMSSSLLFCLDGNKPVNQNSFNTCEYNESRERIDYQELGINISNCDNNKQSNDKNESDNSYSTQLAKEIFLKSQQRKRNCNNLINSSNDDISVYPEDIYNTRKLLIIEENPNETSL